MCQIKKEYTVSENTANIIKAMLLLEESVAFVNRILDNLYGAAADEKGRGFHTAINQAIAELDSHLLNSVHDNIFVGREKKL